ncbi:MAG: DUF4347 domain-containing protein, partial [Pseudomonadota bacterium]
MTRWNGRGDAGAKTRMALLRAQTPLMSALEPRILLDAAGGETAADVIDNTAHASLADAYVDANFPGEASSVQQPAQTRDETAYDTAAPEQLDFSGSEPRGNSLAFVSSGLPDIDALIEALPKDTEVVFLNDDENGLEVIAATVNLRSQIDAIHIITHGDQGELHLGSARLTQSSMSSTHAAQLALIGDSLAENGDILVYGCDFSGGETGQQAVETLSLLTGADVAASTDLTGHSALGGDWDLETRVGEIESQILNAGDAWNGVLADVVLEAHEVDFEDISDDEEVNISRSVGQEFSHNPSGGVSTYEVSQIDLVLRSESPPTSVSVIVTIRETFDGPVLATGSISANSLDDDYAWHSIALDAPVVLDENVQYVFMVATDGTGAGGGNAVEVAVERDNDYPNGAYVRPDGTNKNNHDILFRLIGDDGSNSAPSITMDEFFGVAFVDSNENETAVITVPVTDGDLPNDTLTYSIIDGFDSDLFQIDSATGELSFVNAPDFENPNDSNGNGLYTVEVQVEDEAGETDTQIISVDVLDVNDAPVATGGSVTTDEDVAVVIGPASFGFSDDEGDALQSVTITNLVLAGGTLTHSGGAVAVGEGDTVTLAQLADLTFTPAANSTAPARFDYTVNDDDAGTVAAQMAITVNATNDA